MIVMVVTAASLEPLASHGNPVSKARLEMLFQIVETGRDARWTNETLRILPGNEEPS
jgi:hypothetical protein